MSLEYKVKNAKPSDWLSEGIPVQDAKEIINEAKYKANLLLQFIDYIKEEFGLDIKIVDDEAVKIDKIKTLLGN